MRVAVCVDDYETRKTLEKWIRQYCELYQIVPEVSVFSNAGGLLEAQDSQKFQVTFIGLRGPEGFQDARRIWEEARDSKMVYISDTDKYAVQCIRFHFADYLVLPLTFKSFTRAAKLSGMSK